MVKMKQISREEAERLFQLKDVVSSRVQQDEIELCLFFEYADHTSLIYIYNLQEQNKSYFIEETIVE
jgi:hypothetical protein